MNGKLGDVEPQEVLEGMGRRRMILLTDGIDLPLLEALVPQD
jgi:hypothetical protein